MKPDSLKPCYHLWKKCFYPVCVQAAGTGSSGMTLNQSPVHHRLFFKAHLNGFSSVRSLLITPTTPALISRITHPTVYRLDPLQTH